MSVAARVAREKQEHPERFCLYRGCLWRVRSVRTFGVTPCRKHGAGYVPVVTVRDAMQEKLDGS